MEGPRPGKLFVATGEAAEKTLRTAEENDEKNKGACPGYGLAPQ